MTQQTDRIKCIGMQNNRYGHLYVPREMFGDSAFPFDVGAHLHGRHVYHNGAAVGLLVLTPELGRVADRIDFTLAETDRDADHGSDSDD